MVLNYQHACQHMIIQMIKYHVYSGKQKQWSKYNWIYYRYILCGQQRQRLYFLYIDPVKYSTDLSILYIFSRTYCFCCMYCVSRMKQQFYSKNDCLCLFCFPHAINRLFSRGRKEILQEGENTKQKKKKEILVKRSFD